MIGLHRNPIYQGLKMAHILFNLMATGFIH